MNTHSSCGNRFARIGRKRLSSFIKSGLNTVACCRDASTTCTKKLIRRISFSAISPAAFLSVVSSLRNFWPELHKALERKTAVVMVTGWIRAQRIDRSIALMRVERIQSTLHIFLSRPKAKEKSSLQIPFLAAHRGSRAARQASRRCDNDLPVRIESIAGLRQRHARC
jgi:hypothetical protein